MPLEDYYAGDKVFLKYSRNLESEWEKFEYKKELLALVRGDVDIARPIAYSLGVHYEKWFFSKVPVLDNISPSECMRTRKGIRRLKECLLRFPD